MIRLEARSITRRHGTQSALADVSLTVQGGSILCVLGASGSGKSTLVRQLHLLEAPDAGEVLVDGRRTEYAGPRWLATVRRFGLVQQKPGLLRVPAWQNVAYPLRARGRSAQESRQTALAWVDRLGVGHRWHALPGELSGGEAQRVALARALATQPEALLIDEGTNQLDPHWVRRVESLLRPEAERGAAVVIVTHNVPQALRMADAFVFLDAGRVVETGERDALRDPRTDSLRAFMETG